MLTGRERETAAARALLIEDHGIVAVTGAAGIGKTSIVREVVDSCAIWVHGLATAQARPGAPLSLVLPSLSGDLEHDAYRLVRYLGGERLVLDDAQWFDPYTLAVVELVATAARPVATWRTGDPARTAPPPGHWARLELGPLPEADARALACLARPSLTGRELEQVLELAGGSPLLIEELNARPSPPPNLLSALLSRVRELPDAVRAAVVLVAAAEGGLEEELVDREVHEDLVRSGLAVLVRGRWWPRHELLQESVLEIVEPSEVRGAHSALADLLGGRDPDRAARHAERAGRFTDAVALAESVVADAQGPIEKARATLALADLLETKNPEVAWQLRVAATSDLRNHGAFHEVLTALECRRLPTADAELYGMAHVNLGAAHWALGNHARALDYAEQALDAVEGTGSEAELLVRAGLAMYLTRIRFDGPSALVHARAAMDLAERREQHVAFARTRVAASLLANGDPRWRQEIDRAVAEAISAGHDGDEQLVREARQHHAFLTGDLDTALADLRILTEGLSPPERCPNPRYLVLRLLLELLTLGDRAAITAGVEQLLADEPLFGHRAIAVATGAVASIDMGRADIAHRLLADVETSDPEELLVITWAKTELAWAIGGKLPSADAVGAGEPMLAIHPATTMTAVMKAWCCVEEGTEVPDPSIVILPGFMAAVTETEGLRRLALGDLGAAVRLFDDAADGWGTGSDRRGTLRCRWGAALAADRAEAPDVLQRLDRCWSEARSLGSAPIAARAGRALRQHGVHVAPFPTSAQAPLTARETQALRLVAAGFTTREVATALGLQPDTIADHVRRAVDRLELRTRAQAVCWISERT